MNAVKMSLNDARQRNIELHKEGSNTNAKEAKEPIAVRILSIGFWIAH